MKGFAFQRSNLWSCTGGVLYWSCLNEGLRFSAKQLGAKASEPTWLKASMKGFAFQRSNIANLTDPSEIAAPQ